MPKAKMLLALILVSTVPFTLGWIMGSAYTLNYVVGFASHFINIDPLINKELMKKAIGEYRTSSGGGYLFNETSPLFIGKSYNESTQCFTIRT